MTIWHWNVNGIRAVINSGKFKEFCENGKLKQMCLQREPFNLVRLRNLIKYFFSGRYINQKHILLFNSLTYIE